MTVLSVSRDWDESAYIATTSAARRDPSRPRAQTHAAHVSANTHRHLQNSREVWLLRGLAPWRHSACALLENSTELES